MRKIVSALLGGAMVVTLAAPAWADASPSRHDSVAGMSQLERKHHDYFRCDREHHGRDGRGHREYRERCYRGGSHR